MTEPRNVSRPEFLALLVAAMAAAAIPAWAQAPQPRMLVMPFETSGEPRTWWLGEASAVLLAEDLRALGVDAIARDERLRAFARLQLPAVATLSHGTVIRIGQLVGASAVVIGVLEVEDEKVRVRARSIGLETGRLQQEVEEQGALPQLFDVYDRVARRLLPAGVQAAPEQRAVVPSLPAFENFIKGLLAESTAAQIAFLEKAIALQPDYEQGHLALWRVFSESDEHERALAAALAVPGDSRRARRARFAAANSEIALRRYDEAFARLRALGDEQPAAEVFNNMGVIQLRRGASPETGRATYWFTKATQVDPGGGDYFFNLGYSYWFEQDVQAAIYWLREAVRRDPADADAHFVLSAALRAGGSATEAGRELALAERLSADYEQRARSGSTERVPSGLERLRTALDAGTRQADVALVATEQREQRELAAFHLDRGRRLFEKELDREAIAELRRALYLSPYLSEAHLLLGRIYLRGGRARDAIDEFKIALWSEETPAAHVALAEAWLQAKEPDEARREAERALAMDPEFGAAREFLRRLPPK
jgi:tetratricopeptide (TPR) repeat protein